ncbi:hypothetical protein AAFN47_02930 [Hoeflea sp. CAU 1731]
MNGFRLALASAMFCLACISALADAAWTLKKTDVAAYERLLKPEQKPDSRDSLPDGVLAASNNGGDIIAAWYERPTSRYQHGILGDAIEASVLAVRLQNGETEKLELPNTEVFEDRTPRIHDLDGDGSNEVVTIRSSVHSGASVSVYGLREGRLVQIAATKFIGRPNRWLNVAGIEDYVGNGGLQIAYVQTPHIGGVLKLVELREGKLKNRAEAGGFSNHFIGSRKMGLSASGDFDQDGRLDLALPDADRKALRIVTLANDVWANVAAFQLPARIDKDMLIDRGHDGQSVVIGLENGEYYRLKYAK